MSVGQSTSNSARLVPYSIGDAVLETYELYGVLCLFPLGAKREYKIQSGFLGVCIVVEQRDMSDGLHGSKGKVGESRGVYGGLAVQVCTRWVCCGWWPPGVSSTGIIMTYGADDVHTAAIVQFTPGLVLPSMLKRGIRTLIATNLVASSEPKSPAAGLLFVFTRAILHPTSQGVPFDPGHVTTSSSSYLKSIQRCLCR